MRVATYYNNNDIRLEERPIPPIGEGEVLLKINATGICGSDLMEWYRVGHGPRVLGHEVAGEIVRVGKGVTQHKEGGRIAASHHVPCYDCHYCRLGHHTLCETLRTTHFDPGGFAQYVRLPAINVQHGIYPLPDDLSFEEATLIEPLACTVRAQNKANIRAGQTVLIIGCGIAGLLNLKLARARGAARIIAVDLSDFRLEMAKKFGADALYKASEDIPSSVRAVNEGRLADVAIVCTEAKQGIETALASSERGGTVLFFALSNPQMIIPMPMYDLFWQKGLTLMSSYAASPDDHRESLRLIQSRQVAVKPLISHHLGLSEIATGFQIALKAQDSIKIVLDPAR
ncbi:MAG: alcohol dehydrogenase catalytic domain-containing protein [Deltaproteobacteria bacterium]|nr:alcohol dehydrogenase catalytic domain-containing protein [Deltaproteobacteria bacterium]